MKYFILRFLAGALLLVSAAALPPLVTVILGVCFMFVFSEYYEALFVGLAMDSVFAVTHNLSTLYGFFYTVLFIVLFILVVVLKPRMKWYR